MGSVGLSRAERGQQYPYAVIPNDFMGTDTSPISGLRLSGIMEILITVARFDSFGFNEMKKRGKFEVIARLYSVLFGKPIHFFV